MAHGCVSVRCKQSVVWWHLSWPPEARSVMVYQATHKRTLGGLKLTEETQEFNVQHPEMHLSLSGGRNGTDNWQGGSSCWWIFSPLSSWPCRGIFTVLKVRFLHFLFLSSNRPDFRGAFRQRSLSEPTALWHQLSWIFCWFSWSVRALSFSSSVQLQCCSC